MVYGGLKNKQGSCGWSRNFPRKCFRSLNRMEFIPGLSSLSQAFLIFVMKIIMKKTSVKILSEFVSKLIYVSTCFNMKFNICIQRMGHPLPAMHTGDAGSIPGFGRFPGEGNGNWLQYFTCRIPQNWRILWTEEPDGLQSLRLHLMAKQQNKIQISLYFMLSMKVWNFTNLEPNNCNSGKG